MVHRKGVYHHGRKACRNSQRNGGIFEHCPDEKLQEVLLKNLAENEPQKAEISNAEYLQMFLDAKKIEGCSERTLQYYRVTVERMLQSITTPIRKICTEEIRSYLSGYQQINGCGKVTVDNISP